MLKTSGWFVHAGEWQTLGPGIQRRILAYDDALMMVAVQFETGAVGTMHHHPHRQATYVAAGEFDVVIAGRTSRLKSGDSFFVPPDAEHGVVALTAGTLVDVFTPAREDFVS
ncbi:MAG TPA: cupin domain-containing protein [Longimicrobiales bacterium]